VEIALPDRIIEAEIGAQRHAHLGGHVRIQRQFAERIAGRQRQHRKQHDADAQQAGHGDQQAAQ